MMIADAVAAAYRMILLRLKMEGASRAAEEGNDQWSFFESSG